MNRFIKTLAILFCAAAPLSAKDDSASAKLLDSAQKQTRPFSAAAEPYSLESEFTIQANPPVAGRYVVLWRDEDHWWSRVQIASFDQITIRNGEMEYISRNAPFTPKLVSEFLSLFNLGGMPENLVLEKEKLRTENGKELLCLQSHDLNFPNVPGSFCVDPSTHDLLVITAKYAGSDERRREFANYFEWEGYRYPRSLELIVNGHNTISATVKSLASKPFIPSLLKPPAGAIERRMCADIKHPIPLNHPEPDFRTPGGHPGVESRTTVSATVLTDGSVTNINIIETGAAFMIAPSIDAAKKYKFKPAMCGSNPVESDVTIEIQFRSY